MSRFPLSFFLLLLFMPVALPASAQVAGPVQEASTAQAKSLKKALGLSLLVPGLGHRYVHNGSWRGAASLFALTDAGLWLGLVGTEWRRGQTVASYETLAASRAGAAVQDKPRSFFLNLAAYRSSEAYLEAQLRRRAWNNLDYVEARSFQWDWQSEADFQQFRDLRSDAESLRRRRPFLVSVLVGNRLIAALTAIRAARRAERPEPDVSFSLASPPASGKAPLFTLHARW
ncbi:MAG: hypothetical protein ACR2GR_09625 [Rhodothermales bacterium]